MIMTQIRKVVDCQFTLNFVWVMKILGRKIYFQYIIAQSNQINEPLHQTAAEAKQEGLKVC